MDGWIREWGNSHYQQMVTRHLSHNVVQAMAVPECEEVVPALRSWDGAYLICAQGTRIIKKGLVGANQ